MNAKSIAKALGGRKAGGGWLACSPSHDDRKTNLSIHDAVRSDELPTARNNNRRGGGASAKNFLTNNFAQVPIRVELIGSDECRSEGFLVRAYAPVLALCRKLIAAGFDPSRALHAYRGQMLALCVRSIGEGAKLTAMGDDTGGVGNGAQVSKQGPKGRSHR